MLSTNHLSNDFVRTLSPQCTIKALLRVIQKLKRAIASEYVLPSFWLHAKRWFKYIGAFLAHHAFLTLAKTSTPDFNAPYTQDYLKLVHHYLALGKQVPWLTKDTLHIYRRIQQIAWRHTDTPPHPEDLEAPITFSRNICGMFRIQWRSMGAFSKPQVDSIFPWLFRGHHVRYLWSHRSLQWQQLVYHPILSVTQDRSVVWSPAMSMHFLHWLQLWQTEQAWLETQKSWLWRTWSRQSRAMLDQVLDFNRQRMQTLLSFVVRMISKGDRYQKLWQRSLQQCMPLMDAVARKTAQQIGDGEHELKHQQHAASRMLALVHPDIKPCSSMDRKHHSTRISWPQSHHEGVAAHRLKGVIKYLKQVSRTMQAHNRLSDHAVFGSMYRILYAFMRHNTLPTKLSCRWLSNVIREIQGSMSASSWQHLQTHIQGQLRLDSSWHCRHQWVADHVLLEKDSDRYFKKHWEAWLALPNDTDHIDAIDATTMHHSFYHQLMPWRYAAYFQPISVNAEPQSLSWWRQCWHRLQRSSCKNPEIDVAISSKQFDLFLDRMATINISGQHDFMNDVAHHGLYTKCHEARQHHRVNTWVLWYQLLAVVKKQKTLCFTTTPMMRQLLAFYRRTKRFSAEPKLMSYFLSMLEIVVERMCVLVLKKATSQPNNDPYHQVSTWLDKIGACLSSNALNHLQAHVTALVGVPELLAFDLKTIDERLRCLKSCTTKNRMSQIVDRRLVFILRHPFFAKYAKPLQEILMGIAQHAHPHQRRVIVACAHLPSSKQPLFPQEPLVSHFLSTEKNILWHWQNSKKNGQTPVANSQKSSPNL